MTLAQGWVAVREATPNDRPGMLDLWVDAWTAARPAIDFAARRAWFDGHLDALQRKGVWVGVATIEGGRLAGFVTIDPVSGEMDQLVTAVWAQRRGVGRHLLRHVKRCCPGGLTLSVNLFNAPAIRLYEREGFHAVGEGVSPRSGLPVWHMRWPGDSSAGWMPNDQ